MVVSTSIWYSLSDADKDSYFNTLQFSYYKGFAKNFNVHFTLPLTFSKEIKNEVEKQRFAPGDLLLYIGYKTKYLEPRVGISVPLGYGQNIQEAWIGSNNVKLYGALGYKAFQKSPYFELVGESTYMYFLNDALYGKQSWSVTCFSKGAFKFGEKFKSGVEMYSFYNSFSKECWGGPSFPEKLSFGVVPTLFFSYLPHSRYEFTARGGYGTSRYGLTFKGVERTTYRIINAALAVGVAF